MSSRTHTLQSFVNVARRYYWSVFTSYSGFNSILASSPSVLKNSQELNQGCSMQCTGTWRPEEYILFFFLSRRYLTEEHRAVSWGMGHKPPAALSQDDRAGFLLQIFSQRPIWGELELCLEMASFCTLTAKVTTTVDASDPKVKIYFIKIPFGSCLSFRCQQYLACAVPGSMIPLVSQTGHLLSPLHSPVAHSGVVWAHLILSHSHSLSLMSQPLQHMDITSPGTWGSGMQICVYLAGHSLEFPI